MKLPSDPVGVPVKALAKAIVERKNELGLSWGLRPATVAALGSDGSTRAVLDGDTTPIRVVSMIGRVPKDARVMVLVTPPAGHHIVGWAGPVPAPGELLAKLESNQGQSIAANTDTPVQFNRVLLDVVGGFNPELPTRYTPKVAGWYEFSGGVSFVSGGTLIASQLRKNGTTHVGGSHLSNNGSVGSPSVAFRTSAEFMNGTSDYIEVMAYQNSGAAVNTDTTVPRRPLLVVKYGRSG